jgi:hypothetical protein
MLLRRIRKELHDQNWTSVAIELVIVIVGVFIGTQVSNLNQQRIEKQQTQDLLVRMRPQLQSTLYTFDSFRAYYRTTRIYAGTAFAGWAHDPRISDTQFVIAAYQASQIIPWGANDNTFALIVGADQVRYIADPQTRDWLSQILMFDTSDMHTAAVSTPYRTDVRLVIPNAVQEAIRLQCGDRILPGSVSAFRLPETCVLVLPSEVASAAAAALRARPALVNELNGQLAAEATFLENVQSLDGRVRQLSARLGKTS